MRPDLIEMACEAIDGDDTLTSAEKIVAKFSLRRRPFVRMRAERLIREELEAAGGLTPGGEIAAQFDWIALLKLILPILLTLL